MNRLIANPGGGFTLIEQIMVVAVLTITVSGMGSWFSNYSIRSQINEALSVADSAKIAIIVTCSENPGITALTNSVIGHGFPASYYVKEITTSGSCTSPVITVITINTALLIDPTLTITGNNLVENKQPSWTCISDGLDLHMPDNCHS